TEQQGKTADALRRVSEALAQERRTSYSHGVTPADREWWLGHLGTGEQLLDDCPRELRDWEWHHLQRRCHQDLLTPRGHTTFVAALAFSPDGKRIASFASDDTVKVWDAATGAELLSVPDSAHEGKSLTFSPDGRRLAGAGRDDVIRVWDAATGK